MKPKILLVDDNDANRYLAQYLLEQEGLTVIVAVNGKQALDMAPAEKPDLILLDIQMPEMDGYETAERLQKDLSWTRVPLVGVSSFAMPGDRERAIKIGFAGYIEKPIDPETFVREVEQFLPPGWRNA